jgi:hypothetical protein
MADDADKVEALSDMTRQSNMYNSRRGEPVEKDRRWCDAACRDDWQREND